MTMDDWRPRSADRQAEELEGSPPPDTRYVAECSGVRYAFTEGSWAAFGRDDELCTIVVWECLLDERLSRVAGVLWCVDGELWVRNVSTTHELLVSGGSGPQHLPPRRGPRGAACTVSGPGVVVCAPSTGGWLLRTRPLGTSTAPADSDGGKVSTVTLTRPPESLLRTAVAMCVPLLRRGARPATYQEIGDMTGAKSRTARDRVDRLLAFYQAQGTDRLWRRVESDESNYAPLARLLVHRAVITTSDVGLLDSCREESGVGI